MAETKRFVVYSKNNKVCLDFVGEKSGSVHTELFPSSVAIAMGNKLINAGRTLIKNNFSERRAKDETNMLPVREEQQSQ